MEVAHIVDTGLAFAFSDFVSLSAKLQSDVMQRHVDGQPVFFEQLWCAPHLDVHTMVDI